MKKISILMIAALAALMACQKEAQPQSDARSLAPAVLHASFEAPATTRAGFEYDADGKTYSHFWEVGDRLLWVDKYACPPGDQVSWVNRYDCTDANGTFTRDSHFFLTDDYRGTQSYNGDTQHNYAVYPYSDSYAAALEAFLSDPSNTQSAWYDDWGWDSFLLFGLNSLYINLPATETFAPTANTFGYGNVALAKVDDDFTDVTFRSCMGWLKLQLTGASAGTSSMNTRRSFPVGAISSRSIPTHRMSAWIRTTLGISRTGSSPRLSKSNLPTWPWIRRPRRRSISPYRRLSSQTASRLP